MYFSFYHTEFFNRFILKGWDLIRCATSSRTFLSKTDVCFSKTTGTIWCHGFDLHRCKWFYPLLFLHLHCKCQHTEKDKQCLGIIKKMVTFSRSLFDLACTTSEEPLLYSLFFSSHLSCFCLPSSSLWLCIYCSFAYSVFISQLAKSHLSFNTLVCISFLRSWLQVF